MFDIFYRNLTKEQKEKFCENCGISQKSVIASYLPKNPLKRKVPRTETMVEMIEHSNGALSMLLLVDYFVVAQMHEMMLAKKMIQVRNKRRVSILDYNE